MAAIALLATFANARHENADSAYIAGSVTGVAVLIGLVGGVFWGVKSASAGLVAVMVLSALLALSAVGQIGRREQRRAVTDGSIGAEAAMHALALNREHPPSGYG